MKTAIILHGMPGEEEYFSDKYPSSSNSHWLPWLQKQLLINGYATYTPEIPNSYKLDYKIWREEFERFPVDKESILIGHSCGGGFLLRWLSENQRYIARLIMVAPWINVDRSITNTFFDFSIDSGITKRIDTHLFISSDDDKDIQDSVAEIRRSLPNLTMHQFEAHGHFTEGHMGRNEFPELLQVALTGQQ